MESTSYPLNTPDEVYFSALVLPFAMKVASFFGICMTLVTLLSKPTHGSAANTNLTLPAGNSSSLSNSVAWPGALRVDLLENENPKPLNPVAVYMNAVLVMYQITSTNLRFRWDHKYWQLPEYGVQLIVSKPDEGTGIQTRFVIWGIQQFVITIVEKSLWKEIGAAIFYDDVLQGKLYFAKVMPSINNDTVNNNGTTEVALLGSTTTNGLYNASFVSTTKRRLAIFTNWTGQKLPSSSFFTVILFGMGTAAEEGLDGRVDYFLTHGLTSVYFGLKSDTDQYGNPLLRFGDCRRALKAIAFKAVADRRFESMEVVLELDGTKIADGWLTPEVPHAALHTVETS